MMGPPAPYYCIHCAKETPQVYKTYANGNLVKLLNCEGCGNLVDQYVEYDHIIVAINLLLQNPMAYRHILLNSAFEGFWKLGIVFLFFDAYCEWCFQKGLEHENRIMDYYALETNFYQVLLRTFLRTVVFQIIVISSCTLLFAYRLKAPRHFSYLVVWKGLCLCGFSEIFKLIALIWSYSNDYSRMALVYILGVISNAQAFHVATGIESGRSFCIVVIAFVVSRFILSSFDFTLSFSS